MKSLKYRIAETLEDGERCRFIDEPEVTLTFRTGDAVLIVEISPHEDGVTATLTRPPNAVRVVHTLDDVSELLHEMDVA